MKFLPVILALGVLSVPAAAKAPTHHVSGHASAGIASSAAYVSIHNAGPGADRLIGASSSAARSTTIHTSSNVGGVSRMRSAGPLAIAEGKMLRMAPGGIHIMLVGLKAPLRPGSRLPLTLRFEKAGAVSVSLPVTPPGSGNPSGAGHHGH